MAKRVLGIALLVLIFFHTPVPAESASKGEITFRDALYGAAIGALIGSGAYLIDEKDFGEKLGLGVVIGTVGGLAFGVIETQYFVEMKKDDIKLSAFSLPALEKRGNDIRYSFYLIKVDF